MSLRNTIRSDRLKSAVSGFSEKIEKQKKVAKRKQEELNRLRKIEFEWFQDNLPGITENKLLR